MPQNFQANIADLIVPEVFDPYWMEETAEKVRVLAPMTTNDPAIANAFSNSGSRLIHLPFFKDLDGDSEPLSVGHEISVNRIKSDKDVARRHMRAKGWTVNDLESELTAEDPLAAIVSRVADYWSRQIQKYLFHTLEGVFAQNDANEGGDLIEDVYDAASAVSLDRVILARAKNKIGDSGDMLEWIAIHSDTYTNLQINDKVRQERDSQADLQFESFAGFRIVVDDSAPKVEDATDLTEYTSYLFAPNAVAYGDNFADVPSEIDRAAEFSETRLFTRIHFMIHLRGYKWTETNVDSETPSPAEIIDAANYERVYEKKNIRVVAIKHNSELELDAE